MLKRLWGWVQNKKETRALTTIMVVDDSPVERALIEKILTRHGFAVKTASGGQQALRLVLEVQPQLIVLDSDMPDLSGPKVCSELKSNEATMAIPVMFLTGVDTPSNVVDCFAVDADDYLAKPIDAKRLVGRVDMLLKETASSA